MKCKDYYATPGVVGGGAARAFLQRRMRLAAAHGRQAAPGLDLDLFMVALLLGDPNRIKVFELQVRSLQARLPAHALTAPREGPMP